MTDLPINEAREAAYAKYPPDLISGFLNVHAMLRQGYEEGYLAAWEKAQGDAEIAQLGRLDPVKVTAAFQKLEDELKIATEALERLNQLVVPEYVVMVVQQVLAKIGVRNET